MAPRARFELATLRLTAECSTIELPGNCGQRNSCLSYDSGKGCATEAGRGLRKHPDAVRRAFPYLLSKG
jgi:hypothetical protein